ncbi:MAG: hypothetical protein ACK4UJ_07995 [Leptonema sp. (in: bacteria)]
MNNQKNLFLRILLYGSIHPLSKTTPIPFPSNSRMFFYLISKYNQKLNQLASEKNPNKKYQEITCKYTNLGIRESPEIPQL